MSPVSEELSHQGDVLFQEELSVPKVSKEGPGEVSPEAVGTGCQSGVLIPKMPCVSLHSTGVFHPNIGVPVCCVFLFSPQGSGAGAVPHGDLTRGACKFFC